MKAGKKIEKRLAERQADYSTMVKGRYDLKVQQRMETGGYKMPGSRKKNG